MPQGEKKGGGGILGLLRRGTERLLPGTQIGADGSLDWSNVGLGALVRGGSMIGGLYGGPAAGAGINFLGGKLMNRYSPADGGMGGPERGQFGYDTSLSGIGHAGMNFSPQVGGWLSGPAPQQGGFQGFGSFDPMQNMFTDPGASQWGAFAPNLGLGAAPRGIGYGNGAGAGTGYGSTSYMNDGWGQTAASFGVGAGNSGWANRQSGGDIRGNVYLK